MRPIFRCARLVVLVGLLALGAGACEESQTPEERAREAAEAISLAQPDVEATALAQPIDEAVVKQAQQHLTDIKEYEGELNGKLDSVTVNAIQAFQRTAGLPDTGILDSKTGERLASAARSAGEPTTP